MNRKMASTTENPPKDNLGAVIQVLVDEGRQPMDIYVCCDHSYSDTAMVERCNLIKNLQPLNAFLLTTPRIS